MALPRISCADAIGRLGSPDDPVRHMAASASVTPRAGIGAALRRREDVRFLTGAGRYGDDLALPGMARAVLLRSPHAHARIAAIDTRAAAALPGVLAVLTAADWLADGLRPLPHSPASTSPPDIRLDNRGGAPFFAPPQWPLAHDKVRFAGEGVAFVVAETVALARDAAELVAVDYRVLPAVAHGAAAAEPGAPRLWEERDGNVAIDADVGDAAATA